jgi:hypothetical protein
VIAVALAVAIAGCGGDERQDANEPEQEFALHVVEAEFPSEQSLAESSEMRIRVRNDSDQVAPHIAITIKNDPQSPTGPAFAERVDDPQLADPARPIWIVDAEPGSEDAGEVRGDGPGGSGAFVAHTNTWAFEKVGPGETVTFAWDVTPVRAGSYELAYEVNPGLHGKSTLAPDSGRTRGVFRVSIDDTPAAARVDGDGNVVREEQDADD